MKKSLEGFIYNSLIDPLLRGAQRDIIMALEPGDRVIDIACGTGSLSMAMSEVASEVRGLDLSEDMIRFATQTSARRNISNVNFIAMDASDLSVYSDNHYNVAVSSMAMHQFNANLAIQILKEMKRIASRVIVMDYNYPLTRGFTRFVINSIEKFAGGDHFRNFLKYNELGGLDYFVSQAGLELTDVLFQSSAFRVVECR